MPQTHAGVLSHLHLPSLKKQINDLYLIHSINSLAFSLIGIFIPIFLLQAGFSLTHVLSYFLVRYAAIGVFAFLTIYIANSTGLKHILYARLPLVVLFLLLLSGLTEIGFIYFFVAALDGLQIALYWMPMHSLFIRNSTKGHMGVQVSKWFSFPKLLSLFGPLMGGFITVIFGFKVLFLTAVVILIVSVLPLYFTKEIKPHVSFEFKEGAKMFKKHPKYFFAAIGEGIFHATEGLIWPIFVFLALGSILSIGYIGTLLGLGSIGFILLLGRLADKVGKRTILHVGVPLVITLWILRIFATTETRIYIITLTAGFLVSLLTLPFTSITYDLAKKNHIDEFVLYRETALAVGRIFLILMAIALVNQLWVLFPIAAIGTLLYLLI